jgi:hypothetical protein
MKRFVAVGFVLALLVLLLAGTLFVNLVAANPFFPSGSWSDDPTPPVINIHSPLQNQPCGFSHDVWLNFTVTRPSTSWYRSGGFRFAITIGSVTSVIYYLDEKPPVRMNARGQVYSVNLGVLSDGQHVIKINVEGLGHSRTTITHDLYRGSKYTFEQSVPNKHVSSSAQVSFIVDNNVKVDSVSSSTLALTIVALVASLSVGFGAFLHKFKKRKAEL